MAVNSYPASSYPWFAAVTNQDLNNVQEDIPEILEIQDPDIRHKTALVFASLLREGPYKRISEAPHFSSSPGKPREIFGLAGHSRHVARCTIDVVETLTDVWGIKVRHDIAVSAAILHDSDQLANQGRAFLHAQYGGIRCHQAGLPSDIGYIVMRHFFTPPHIYLKPPTIESVIVAYADLNSADTIYFHLGQPTHQEIIKRFFSIDEGLLKESGGGE